MESYRISRWTEPPAGPSQLQLRKALIAMSVGWVSRTWLERHAGLGRREIDALFDRLEAEGVLMRCEQPPVVGEPQGPARGGARGLLQRVSRRIADAALPSRRREAGWTTAAEAFDGSTQLLDAAPTAPAAY